MYQKCRVKSFIIKKNRNRRVIMTLRDHVTKQILKNHPIPAELQNPKYSFYYQDYADNLYCPMGEDAERAYAMGKGAETKPQTITRNGMNYTIPAKMSSIASSSAMTFNLLGNDSVDIMKDGVLPSGTYDVEYEKRMHTIAYGDRPAHLDAFLSGEGNKTGIFCEMKNLEWLGEPSNITRTYFKDTYYFKADERAVNYPRDGFAHFAALAEALEKASFIRYDGWQMFKHLLAIYNYTSLVTKDSVNRFDSNGSMAGKYDNIILANIVNEFPVDLIEDKKWKVEYEKALYEEREEAKRFRDIVKKCNIPTVFDNNCNAGIRIEYISVMDFADSINMSTEKRKYLERYYR